MDLPDQPNDASIKSQSNTVLADFGSSGGGINNESEESNQLRSRGKSLEEGLSDCRQLNEKLEELVG